jgi:hypothetical protein
VVAGVEATEHPPSSLEGVEQPSEAVGEKKNPITFTSQIDITDLYKHTHSYSKNSNISISSHVSRGQKLFVNISHPLNYGIL